MRISRTQVEAVIRSYLDQIRTPGTGSGKPASTRNDQITVSSDAAQVSKWVELARSLPEVRSAELQRVRSKMAEGVLYRPSEQLAQKMLDQLLIDAALKEQSDDGR